MSQQPDIDSYFMKSIGIYSSENTRYCIIFSSIENYSCQTRFYEKFYLYQIEF